MHVWIQGAHRWARCLCGDLLRINDYRRYSPYYQKVYVHGNHFIVYFGTTHKNTMGSYSQQMMDYIESRRVGGTVKKDSTDYYFGESEENKGVI